MNHLSPQTHERESACTVHGAYTERGGSFTPTSRVMWFGCPACNKVHAEAEEAERIQREEAARQQRIEARMKSAGIPPAFRDRTFENYAAETPEQVSARDLVQDFAANFWTQHHAAGTFLVLGGNPGTGKGHLACAAAAMVARRGTVMYLRTADVIRRVRDTWRRDSQQSEGEVVRLLGEELDLLVMDEIGVQRGTEDEQIILFDVLDRRYASLRPTIMLTNLGGNAFKEFVGPRIMDRLTERAIFVPFNWSSYRSRR